MSYIVDSCRLRVEVERVGLNLRAIKGAKDGANEELYVFMDDFLEQAFYLFCAVELEYKKHEDLNKQEEERLQEFADLEAARPIFSMLKEEVRKWEWGNDFDEFTISKYIAEMVALGKKHNIDLGINLGINNNENVAVEEITTTYATELEVLEDR